MTLGMLLAVSVTFSFGEVRTECAEPNGWKISLTRETAPDGAEIARLALDRDTPAAPPQVRVVAVKPQNGETDRWNVNEYACSMPATWCARSTSDLAHGMPHWVFFNGNDEAVFSVAASECLRKLDFVGGIVEERSRLETSFTYFTAPEAPLSHYETFIRYDAKRRPFADSVRQGVAWIERAGGYTPCVPPRSAFDPLYSSWYCFHQDVHADDLEAELALAAKYGMKTLIVDDGWQTEDNHRGYSWCGDWKVSKKRFPDMAAHVRRAQALGFKYMMWYSVPFVGVHSENYERFKGKYLIDNDRGMGAAVLDPRFPEVRAFLVKTYTDALKDWNLDGFKLDFIDSFRFEGADPAVKEDYAGRDIKSLPHAVDRLMTEVREALTAIKPDLLIEFRQSYIGPAIRRCGNMLRVGDCPGNMRRNRFAIANLRLASGGTAVHSDMLEWNFAEPAQKAALYIINSIFGVVQYSVMLRDAPEEHRAMIAKWIAFSQEHRDTLLSGTFTPHHPELQYPVIEAEGADEIVIGLYDDGRVVDVRTDKRTFVMNASGRDSFVIRRDGKLSEIACASGDWVEIK